MSHFDDYIGDDLCCEQCGRYMGGDEPGFIRVCADCQDTAKRKPAKAKRKGKPQ